MAKAKRRKVDTMQPGFDGAQIIQAEVRVSAYRTRKQAVRAQPGTFEWRYGRNQGDPLYHAGSHFARLWERASHLGGATVDWSASGGGDWKGLPDGRAVAMQTVGEAMKDIGKLSSRRLTDYCVLGLTSDEIAKKHNIAQRDAPAVLRQDLRACAIHFRFI